MTKCTEECEIGKLIYNRALSTGESLFDVAFDLDRDLEECKETCIYNKSTILDGKLVSRKIREKLKEEVLRFHTMPTLAVVMVGDDPASQIYVRNKQRACDEIGIHSETIKLPADTTQGALEAVISSLDADDDVDGILVQLPLPKHINVDKIMEHISPIKDVDGFTFENIGKLMVGDQPLYIPCTPKGILSLLYYYNINVEGKVVVVIGRSIEVGKPISQLLLNRNATVITCHSHTDEEMLGDLCRKADIIISAVGKPNFVNRYMIKKKAIIIDVGMNHNKDGKLVGDVDYQDVKNIVSYITPVPGGVGPMTITSLMENVVLAYKNRRNL